MTSLRSSNDEAIQFIRGLTGYTPNDQSRLSEALQAAGYSSQDGNKNLALPGDAVIKVHLIMQGLQRHQCRERINIVVSSIASNDNLGRRGFELGLEQYIQGNPAQRGEVSTRTMATTLEAIIGAIFIDSGFDYAVISNVMARLGLGWPQ
ncbi:RNAse [Talaromyces pinophilus]|uniref:RNAse n=1 Tax=Talaromyces pinophilus TaxID=128442 RepID=A0A6V8HCZ5_TALPI|nr:RNAse [Talaromyces pinophilus]